MDESILTTGLNPTYLYLANKQHPVDENYDPGTLVSLEPPYASGGKLEERTAQALYAMMDEMRAAARELEFEHAAKLRDEIKKLNGEEALERASKPKPGTIGSKRRNKGRSRK